MHEVLRYSKEEIQEIPCREEDGSIYYMQKHEAEDVHMLVHYQCHFIAKEIFPEDIHTFMLNTISRKYWRSFVNHPDAIASIISTGDITAKPPTNTGLADNFKVTFSPADSLKKSIKRDAGLFTNFKEGNNVMNGAGTPSPLLERRTQQKF